MDHRWDEGVRQARIARAEREQQRGVRHIGRDLDVERRDHLVSASRRRSFSPWDVGAAHWDQRDLYTRGQQIDDAGYGRGPSYHPEEGSYAYPRSPSRPPPSAPDDLGPNVHERAAWPWLNYHDDPERHARPGLLSRLAHEAQELKERLLGRSHAGKGPKNWTRSDLRVYEDVCDALAERGDLDATDIDVEVEDAEVTLRGTVPDRRSKRLAEHVAERCYGVRDVHNRLKVRPEDDTGDADVVFARPAVT